MKNAELKSEKEKNAHESIDQGVCNGRMERLTCSSIYKAIGDGPAFDFLVCETINQQLFDCRPNENKWIQEKKKSKTFYPTTVSVTTMNLVKCMFLVCAYNLTKTENVCWIFIPSIWLFHFLLCK